MDIEQELEVLQPEPKTTVEIIAEKNEAIEKLQAQVKDLTKQLSDVGFSLHQAQKTLSASKDNEKTMQTKLNCAHDAYDSLLEKLIDKI